MIVWLRSVVIFGYVPIAFARLGSTSDAPRYQPCFLVLHTFVHCNCLSGLSLDSNYTPSNIISSLIYPPRYNPLTVCITPSATSMVNGIVSAKRPV